MDPATGRRRVTTYDPPYARLNLRYNPFGELDLAMRGEVADVDVRPFVARLRQPGYAVQFLGEPGRGKTTHLLAIARQFSRAAYVRIGEGERPAIPPGCPLLIDEVQRLPRWRRWLLFRRPVSFVLAGHFDVGSELGRSGVAVQTVRLGQPPEPEVLCRMLNRRIEAARWRPGGVPRVCRSTAEALVERFGSDIRAIEWHLYDLFQQLEGIGDA